MKENLSDSTLQRLFFELPVIKNPKAKKLATLVLVNEFDYIIREAREIFDENLKKEVPILDVIQQVFNNVNQHYSWIVAGGYDVKQLNSAKVSMDNMFYVVFTKPHDKNSSKEIKDKGNKT